MDNILTQHLLAEMNRDKLIELTDKHITELVIPKVRVQKAYNYINCIIDTEQFRYLEENYGINNPTTVTFIPLIKKHVDALVGEHLEVPLTPTVSCKDSGTLNQIARNRQLRIKAVLAQFYRNLFRKEVLLGITGRMDDETIRAEQYRLIQDTNLNYISEFELAANDILAWILQARPIDIYNKRRELLVDMLTAGQCYYRSYITPDGRNIALSTYNPMNVFPDKNPESNYVRDASRIVIRRWMTRQDVLNAYGKELNGDTVKELNDIWRDGNLYNNSYIIRSRIPDAQPFPVSQHIGDDINITPGLPEEGNHRLNYFIPVYEVEWIETEKENGVWMKNRYRTVRIGETIYITYGKDKNVIRTIDNPTDCKLSVNGLFFTNRNNKPFSLVLQCGDLQDKYNIIHYLRDNALANSGTTGTYVDVSKLPTFLGGNMIDRLERFLGYMKQGVGVFDSSQDGTPMVNTFFNGFDNSIKVPTIQAYEMALQSIEKVVSSITGVFQQRLDGIQQYDAVRNVQAGARNSYTVTKWIYQQMDSLERDMLMDMLDQAKIAYKDGLQGELILGPNRRRVFTALPQHFTTTDYDVHIPSSSQTIKDMETMKGVVGEFIKAGNYEPDVIMECMTATSMTELKTNISRAYAEKEKKENVIGRLNQKIEELSGQLQQAQTELQKAQQKIEQLDEAKLQLEQHKLQLDSRLGLMKLENERRYNNDLIEVKNKQLDAELAQQHDGNPYNDHIKDV